MDHTHYSGSVTLLLPILLGMTPALSAQLVQVGPFDPNYCQKTEHVVPNLTLSRRTAISGQIRDASLASFAHSKVELRRYVSSSVQTSVTTVETDDEGHFSLGDVKPGEYRLLASPARWAAQPEKLECFGKDPCHLDIVLKMNPTDQPLSQCPIR